MQERLDLSSFDQDERGELEALGLRPGTLGADSPCPDPSLLLAAQDGVLDAPVADEVLAHVAACPACTMLLADLATVFAEGAVGDADVRIAARVRQTGPRTSRRLMWGLAGGGLLIAASIAGLVVNLERAPLPVAVPFIGAPAVVSPNQPTVFYVDPATAEPEDVELTLRGEAPPIPSRGGSESEPPGRPVADEAEWREAVALVHAGDIDGARRALHTLCSRPTWRGALACAGLIELDRRPHR